jgi:hypothetical protein
LFSCKRLNTGMLKELLRLFVPLSLHKRRKRPMRKEKREWITLVRN